MSSIIYEVLDFGTAVTDSNGNIAASGAGIPAFIAMCDKAVQAVLNKFDDKEIKPGTKASKVFKSYSDKIFEIGLTPNRCDAISHFGVSRDLRAAISYRKDKQIDLISPSISNFHNTIISPNLNIDISDSKDCRRFCGLIINNIVTCLTQLIVLCLRDTFHLFIIEIKNFLVFESKPTKAKPRARNPKTNEEIYVPAHKKTRFKPGKILKAYLRKPI